MVRWQVAVIVAGNSSAAFAAKTATTLVFAPPEDPVRLGLVGSLAHMRSHVRSRQVRTKWTVLKGWLHFEAMSGHHNFRPGQQNKLVSEPPIAAPDEHAQLVEADQRFRAALGQAIAAGGERIEAVEATVQLKRRTKLPR